MAGSRKITIEFLGKDSSSATAMAVEKRYGKLGSRLDQVGQRAGKVLAVGFLAAGVAAVKMGKAAAQDEAAASKLAQTLRTAAGATKGQIAATEDWITAQGKSLGVSDDELRPALGRLVVATHDVGKAQRLASLAMDISAGSGKDLGAVAFALAKAQNGNVAGLARLGVATKDASGKTLTLDQITQNLAATYKGAAATAADTTAGKQRKLSVAFGELQEEIGTKLLPVMLKLSEVGMKMVNWIDHNQTSTLVLVGVLGTLAAGLYAASVAMRVMVAVTTLQEMAAKRAAAGQATFSASTLALRGGALAAAGGLAVLAAKAGGTQTTLGGLATVGAGLAAGFALGGPWGAAIGGAGGLLSVFAHRGDAAKGMVQGLTATLDQQTGAVTENTRQWVAKQLVDSGAADTLKEMGVSLTEATDAVFGNTDAVIKQTAAHRDLSFKQAAALSSLNGLSDGVTKGIKNTKALAGVSKEAGTATGGASTMFTHLGTSAGAAATDVKTLQDALSGLLDPLLSQEDASNAWRDSIASLTADLRTNGATLADNTVKGRANQNAIRDRVKALRDSANADVAAGGTQEEFTAKMKRGAAQILAAGHAAHISEDKMRGYLKQLGLTPKQINTAIHADTSSFAASLRYVYASMAKVGRLSATAKINMHASDYPGNAAGTDNWGGGITWVGEEGPELLNLPKGSQIIPSHKTDAYMASHAPSVSPMGGGSSGGGGSQRPVVVYLTLDGRVVAQSLVKFENDTGRPIGLRAR